jgi:peptidoglycan/LPS O-acetylase OafA/YrhL
MTTAGEPVATLISMDRTVVRKTAAVMAFVAVSLFVASAVHLLGNVHGRADIFDADDAGIAEAIIGVVLAVASAVMVRVPAKARAVGMGAVGFAIAGFGVGLTITSEGGHAPDIAYHVVVLPILIGTFIALARSGSPRGARRAPVAG